MSKSKQTFWPLIFLIVPLAQCYHLHSWANNLTGDGDYWPVCGSDQITYLHARNLEKAASQSGLHKIVDYEGPCRASCTKDINCPHDIDILVCHVFNGIAKCGCEWVFCPLVFDTYKYCGNDGEFRCATGNTWVDCPPYSCRDKGLKLLADPRQWLICRDSVFPMEICRAEPAYQHSNSSDPGLISW